MAQVVRPYRGVSADERRALRRARLVEAALDVLAIDGIANLTMTAVRQRAGLTERYFYESFRDRAELLEAVLDAYLREMDKAMFNALRSAPPDLFGRCRAAAGAMIAALTDDPRKARLYVEAAGADKLKERRARAISVHAEILADQMRELGGLDSDAHQAPVRLASLVIIGGLADAIGAWIDGTLEMSRDTLVEECARLAVAAAEAVKATTAHDLT
jgi:AcrR family transcriptional regulator